MRSFVLSLAATKSPRHKLTPCQENCPMLMLHLRQMNSETISTFSWGQRADRSPWHNASSPICCHLPAHTHIDTHTCPHTYTNTRCAIAARKGCATQVHHISRQAVTAQSTVSRICSRIHASSRLLVPQHHRIWMLHPKGRAGGSSLPAHAAPLICRQRRATPPAPGKTAAAIIPQPSGSPPIRVQGRVRLPHACSQPAAHA